MGGVNPRGIEKKGLGKTLLLFIPLFILSPSGPRAISRKCPCLLASPAAVGPGREINTLQWRTGSIPPIEGQNEFGALANPITAHPPPESEAPGTVGAATEGE